MFEPLPPRRDPRVLVVDPRGAVVRYAALDAWELKGAGTLKRSRAAPSLRRLAFQVKPSHVVLLPHGARAHAALRRDLASTSLRGVALLVLSATDFARITSLAPSLAEVRATYPPLQHLAPSHAAMNVTRIALAILLHHPLPPRHYASPRLSPRSAPGLAS